MNAAQSTKAVQAKNIIAVLVDVGVLLDEKLKIKYFRKTCLQKLDAQGDNKSEVLTILAASTAEQLRDLDNTVEAIMKGICLQISDLSRGYLIGAWSLNEPYNRILSMLRGESTQYGREIPTVDLEILNLQAFVRALQLESQIFDIFSEQNAQDLKGNTELVKVEELLAHIEKLSELNAKVTARAVEKTDWPANSPPQVLIRKKISSIHQLLSGMQRNLELRMPPANSDFSINIHS